ncbi:MAG: hypothetical protein M3430_05170 [Acidobacteriota bacterium]|nr:hypothetical protein [Acidobacteriota bacterium]
MKSTRAARSEDLCEARAGLAKRSRVVEIAAVADQVGGIEQVEDFTIHNEPHSLASEREGAAEAQVLGEEAVAGVRLLGYRYRIAN